MAEQAVARTREKIQSVTPWKRWNPEPFYRFGARWLTRLIYRPRYEGFENLPKSGAAIIIANHISYVDGLIISAACDRNIRYIIDKAIFELPGVHYFMTLAKGIPVEPNRESVTRMLEEVENALREGDLVCIFPEGQLTYTGHLGRFRPGIEWILKRYPVPVYPIALKGLWGSVFSRKYRKSPLRWLPRFHKRRKIEAICGPMIPPAEASINHLQKTVIELLGK
ncbi:MAG: 1-acyl-sn-glycerol-3-phosphate acyltransferase [Alphaproteobacteria bacterium]|nr:1-acyl-sn-glycerol-3-phosphate acyltransferase [Alphaproteobacteria bacterium]